MLYKDFIKKLQLALNEHGENLKLDGDFGPKTAQALEKYDVEFALTRFDDSTIKIKPQRNLDAAVKIIKEFEGLYLKAYLCPARIPTIGWGTIKYPNGEKVKMGDVISETQAEAFLLFEVNHFANEVERLVKAKISDNAFCALVSFCYNLGAGALEKSTLLRLLNSGEYPEDVAPEFMKWVKADGKTLTGLQRRRKAEMELFLS